MSEPRAGTREYLQKANSLILKKVYKRMTKHPKIGFALIRLHCRVRPDFTDADPLKTVWTDPSRITAISNYSPRRAYGVVASGKWDKNCTPIDELPAYKGVSEFIENDNEQYLRQIFKQHVEEKTGSAWGHVSMKTFDKRLDEIQRLYNSIKEQGYLAQSELLQIDKKKTVDRNNDAETPLLNEITVDIGRDGDLLYCGYGSHRLAIAKILELDSVCVKVGARHKKWQQLRDKIRSNKYTPHHSIKYKGHPDLRDIISDETA